MRKDGVCHETFRPSGRIERIVEPSAGVSVSSDALTNNVRVEVIREGAVEVEVNYERPTAAERKAVEGFFDWLLAEALRSAGEIDEAA